MSPSPVSDSLPFLKRDQSPTASPDNNKRRKIELTEKLANTKFETIELIFSDSRQELNKAKHATEQMRERLDRANRALERAKNAVHFAVEKHSDAIIRETKAADKFLQVTMARDARSVLVNRDFWKKEVESCQGNLSLAEQEQDVWTSKASTVAEKLNADDLEAMLKDTA